MRGLRLTNWDIKDNFFLDCSPSGIGGPIMSASCAGWARIAGKMLLLLALRAAGRPFDSGGRRWEYSGCRGSGAELRLCFRPPPSILV